MAPSYKLTYFNVRGVAEPIRWLFLYGNIAFEDDRFEMGEWPKIKANFPYGQAPILEHDGKVVNQSVAIGRYVAKLVGLAGNNDWEDLEIDAIVDTIFGDLRDKIIQAFKEPNEDRKKELLEKVVKEHVPYYFERFESLAKKNNGFLALGRLTWADFFFVSIVEILQGYYPNDKILGDGYPELIALKDKVFNIPNVKKWIEVRPKTQI